MHPMIHGERDMEAARAGALSRLPPPPVNVTLQNNVKVWIDGAQIAARIEATIVKKFEHSHQAPSSDSHLAFHDGDYGILTG